MKKRWTRIVFGRHWGRGAAECRSRDRGEGKDRALARPRPGRMKLLLLAQVWAAQVTRSGRFTLCTYTTRIPYIQTGPLRSQPRQGVIALHSGVFGACHIFSSAFCCRWCPSFSSVHYMCHPALLECVRAHAGPFCGEEKRMDEVGRRTSAILARDAQPAPQVLGADKQVKR